MDIHTETAATILGIRPEDVTPEQRLEARELNFGRVYGRVGFDPPYENVVGYGQRAHGMAARFYAEVYRRYLESEQSADPLLQFERAWWSVSRPISHETRSPVVAAAVDGFEG